jgi:predicted nucleotidyltransferase component of viral defense system
MSTGGGESYSMAEFSAVALRVHEDRARFSAALTSTAAATGFPARLVEKDYFCTLLLSELATGNSSLVFKGGTCLAKVHGDFYRLSEDLDFTVPMAKGSTRGDRRARARDFKADLAAVETKVRLLRMCEAPTGANVSTQYVAVMAYSSVLRSTDETVKVEVGLREPLLTPAVWGRAKTLLLDPVTGSAMVPDLDLRCLSREEAMAEKLRAALSRREVAIRDFYDVDHAFRRMQTDPCNPALIDLVRRKLAEPGNSPPNVSAIRLDALREQLEAELAPVLRRSDFAAFDLDRAWATVSRVATAVREQR